MDIKYDPKADALYIRIKKGKISETREEGDFLVDYNDKEEIMGIEVLFYSKKFPTKSQEQIVLKHAI
jgi:uncharacterized protein YuzE